MLTAIKWVITLIATILFFIHLICPDINLDLVSVSLFAIAIAPWISHLLKSVELPGGFKFEFGESERLKKELKRAGMIELSPNANAPASFRYSFESVADEDINLALAGLRIEIERRIKDIAQRNDINANKMNLFSTISNLNKYKILNNDEVGALKNLIHILNQAVHGAKIDTKTANQYIEIGRGVLRFLDEQLESNTVHDLLERWRRKDGAEFIEIGQRLAKCFIKTPNEFIKAMHHDKESFTSWVNSLRENTFTIFEAADDIDDELYTAYYERLKSMMIAEANALLDSEYRDEAATLIETLNQIKVRRLA